MKIRHTMAASSVRRAALGAFLVGFAYAGCCTAASAATDVSINAASYTYNVFDATGAPIAISPQSQGGDQVGFNYTDSFGNPAWVDYDVAFWTGTTTFNASTGGTLTITDLQADDATAVLLNGVVVAAAGIENYGTGDGQFVFTPDGPSVPQTFSDNGDITTTTPVVVNGLLNGPNTLEIIVNNTFDGINDDCTDDGAPDGLCGFNPTYVGFSGSVTGSVAAVPEPATWAMFLIGFGAIGWTLRGARRARATTA